MSVGLLFVLPIRIDRIECLKLSRFLGIVIGMFYQEHGVLIVTPCTGSMKSPSKLKRP